MPKGKLITKCFFMRHDIETSVIKSLFVRNAYKKKEFPRYNFNRKEC